MTQTVGEFEEKTKEAGLDLVIEKPETPVYIMRTADISGV